MTSTPERARSSRDRRVDRALVAAIVVRTLYGLAMLPLIPLLIGPNPLLLTLLSGSTVAEVVLGARIRVGDVPWALALAVTVPLWVLTDWLYWAAGRRWGDRALAMLTPRGDPGRAAARAERAHRAMHRLGPAGVVLAKFLPVPTQLSYAVAGAGGMRLPVFLVLNLIGVTLAAAGTLTLGYAVGESAVGLVESFQQYAGISALALVVLLVVVHLVRRRRIRARSRRETLRPAARGAGPRRPAPDAGP
ncbi:hypothetical protein GCM10009737_14900 [Nocardioides lentus]|uniref:VTT domain-containing protein n=1 Tax=Nocardioides lentus TaxID=338077 RepID=A0ABN2PAA8_9ACTN